MPFRHLPWVLTLSLLGAGCLMTTRREVDREVCEIARLVGEPSVPTGSDLLPAPPPLEQPTSPTRLPQSCADFASIDFTDTERKCW